MGDKFIEVVNENLNDLTNILEPMLDWNAGETYDETINRIREIQGNLEIIKEYIQFLEDMNINKIN